jgi:acyl carrier protein
MVSAKDIEKVLLESNIPHSENAYNGEQALVEQGIGSLDTALLIMAVEDRYKVTVPPNNLPSLRTLNDIAASVNRLLGS